LVVPHPGKDPVMLRYQWISAAASILLFWAFYAYDAIQKEEVEEKRWPWHEQPFIEHTDLKIDKKFKVHVSGIWSNTRHVGNPDSVFWLDNETLLLAGNSEAKDPGRQPLSLYVWRIGQEPIHLVRAPRRDEHSRERGLLDPSLELWNGVTACGGQDNIVYVSGYIPLEDGKVLTVYDRINAKQFLNGNISVDREIINEGINPDQMVGSILRVDCSIGYYKTDFKGFVIPLPFLNGKSYIDVEKYNKSKVVFGDKFSSSNAVIKRNYLYDYKKNMVLFPTGTLAGQFPGKRFEQCIGFNELDAEAVETQYCLPEGPWTKAGGYFSIINDGLVVSDKNHHPNILYISDRHKSWDFMEIGQGPIVGMFSSPDQCKVLVKAVCQLNEECADKKQKGYYHYVVYHQYVFIDFCERPDDRSK
jgi:hypothetical protein